MTPGARVTIVDLRAKPTGAFIREATAAGIEILAGHAVIAAHGNRRVARVEIAPLDSTASVIDGDIMHRDCDLIAMSGGLSPAVHLHSQARGKLQWDDKRLCFKPSTTHEASFNAGAGNGTFDLAGAIKEGIGCGARAAKAAGCKNSMAAASRLSLPDINLPKQSWAPLAAWKIPNGHAAGAGPKAFVDFQNDVTASDVSLAAREGYQSVEHCKALYHTWHGHRSGQDVEHQRAGHSCRCAW
jgi:sarcosine oxidase subunit alpha